MAAKAKHLVSPIQLREIRKKLDNLLELARRANPFVTREILQAHAYQCQTAREDLVQEIEALALARERDAVELEELRRALAVREEPKEALTRAREEIAACWRLLNEAKAEGALEELSPALGRPLDATVRELLYLVGALKAQIPNYRWEAMHQQIFEEAMRRNRERAALEPAPEAPKKKPWIPTTVTPPKKHRCLAIRDDGVDRDMFTVHFLDDKPPVTHYGYTLIGVLERHAQNGHDRHLIQEDMLDWLRNVYAAGVGELAEMPHGNTVFQIRVVREEDVSFDRLIEYPKASWAASHGRMGS